VNWLRRHAFTLYTAALVVVFAAGLAGFNRASVDRARDAWRSDLRTCDGTNESRRVLRDFVTAASADPDPRQYEFIADKALRDGVLEQARRSRATMRADAARAFAPLDCPVLYPEPR
jgi:hypothetical protein